MTAPTILHVDMDAFYASVELLERPELAGLPVAVGGSAEGRGVISAASYVARKWGVRSAMATARALRLCPQLVLLPPDFEKYTAASRRIMEIFRRYTPLVEPLSLDEAFLDVKGCERLFGDGPAIGRAIKADVLRETGLVASVGVAPTKFLAKLASDLDKPDGFRVIQEGEVRAVLDPLPVSKIFGVGERTAERLERLGIRTIGQLARLPRDEVERRFGASGAWIHDLAHGLDERRVVASRVEKSHGRERTFERDIADREELRRRLAGYCEEVAHELRSRSLRGRTVTLKARYADFRTVTRARTLEHATQLGPRLFATARELLDKLEPGPLRLLGVSVSALEDAHGGHQATLFDDAPAAEPATDARLARAQARLDALRAKYGANPVVLGSSLTPRERDRDA